MAFFSRESLGSVLNTIDKAVTDKDKKNELIEKTTEAHIQNVIHARENLSGIARWVRGLLAIIIILVYAYANKLFISLISELDISDEIKVTFYFKILSDIIMILLIVLGFYFGSSEFKSDNIQDIRKNIGKLK